jgi:hypothetical protein
MFFSARFFPSPSFPSKKRGKINLDVPFSSPINEGRFPSLVIPLVTGNTVDDDVLRLTYDSTTASKLTTAFAASKVVVASTLPTNTTPGLVAKHSYAVVDWNATTNQVTLFNPHGSNPNYTVFVPGVAGPLNGPIDRPRISIRNLGRDGYFTVPLAVFTSMFSYIDYEQ